jgi:biotin transport system substrate-specific component
MFNEISWNKPQQWHMDLSSDKITIQERIVSIAFFAGLTALCAQISFVVPWTPIPYTFQTFAVLATGVYLRRNDAFASGFLYLAAAAIGAPVLSGGGSELFSDGRLIASGGYLVAFPFASALVAEGLERSRNAGTPDLKAQMVCWFIAMIPVYLFGTLWLAEFASLSLYDSFMFATYPFLVWDFAKIYILLYITTNVWTYSSEDEEESEPDPEVEQPQPISLEVA